MAGRAARRPRAVPQDGDPVSAIADARPRVRARFEGEVRRIRVQSLAGAPTLEVQLDDGTGRLSALFMGRRGISGIECGRRLAIEGTPVTGERGLTLYNPAYDLR
jgi:RecG-like helicase